MRTRVANPVRWCFLNDIHVNSGFYRIDIAYVDLLTYPIQYLRGTRSSQLLCTYVHLWSLAGRAY